MDINQPVLERAKQRFPGAQVAWMHGDFLAASERLGSFMGTVRPRDGRRGTRSASCAVTSAPTFPRAGVTPPVGTRIHPVARKLTARSICILFAARFPDRVSSLALYATAPRQARVTVRYFYESFTDKDDFVASMFDWVIADIAATTTAAVTAAPLKEQSRAGMANIVRTIAADTRVGRLLFSSQLSNPVVVRKRAESGALMAMLLLQHTGAFGAQNNDAIAAISHFAVGGVEQTITAWLAGDITLDSDQLVDRLAAIIDQLAMPELDKGLGQQRDSPQRHTGIERV